MKPQLTLSEYSPELAAQWHPTKNGNLTPDQVPRGSRRSIWWHCPTCGHEWQATVENRAWAKTGCPKCSRIRGALKRTGAAIEHSGSLKENRPALSAQWHPTKNGSLSPDQTTCGSNRKVWWRCPECDLEWQATIASRALANAGCPKCSRNQTLLVRNGSLMDKDPALSTQWHPTRNGSLAPNMVTIKSNKKVWWLCPKCNHEWQATVGSRSTGSGCPECYRKRVALARERK